MLNSKSLKNFNLGNLGDDCYNIYFDNNNWFFII